MREVQRDGERGTVMDLLANFARVEDGHVGKGLFGGRGGCIIAEIVVDGLPRGGFGEDVFDAAFRAVVAELVAHGVVVACRSLSAHPCGELP